MDFAGQFAGAICLVKRAALRTAIDAEQARA